MSVFPGATTAAEPVALLDGCPPGNLAPTLRAEHDLARVRLTARDGGSGASSALAAAVSGLREPNTPCYLAHTLLDQAGHFTSLGEAEAAEAAINEARTIAERLRCQPLLDWDADLTPAEPRIGAPMVTSPGPEESAPADDG